MLANMDRLERRLIADVLDPTTINAKRLINDLGLPVQVWWILDGWLIAE